MDNLSRLLVEGGRLSKFPMVIKRQTWDDFDVISRAGGNMQFVQLLGRFSRVDLGSIIHKPENLS